MKQLELHSSSLPLLCTVLRATLNNAAELAGMADDAMAAGKTNQAIGTLIPVEQQLDAASALLQTILVLKRCNTGGA